MVFAGIVGTDVGLRPFGYVTSMVVTIALWLTVAPAIGAVARGPGKNRKTRTSKPRGSATILRLCNVPGRHQPDAVARPDEAPAVAFATWRRRRPHALLCRQRLR